MGLFTVLDDNRVDEKIAADLRLVVDKVTIASPVLAIVLGGGFGRGEGSVLVTENGIQPLNDYDLFVVVPDDDRTDFRSLSTKIIGEVDVRLIDLMPIKVSSLSKLPPTQSNYDLKYGSRHLWGENVLDVIPQYDEGCVSRGSARTLLLNRLICAIEAYSDKYEQRDVTRQEAVFLATQTGKVVSACVEALLIQNRKYHHSYRRRQGIFDDEFPEKDCLRQLNKISTEFKLRPSSPPRFNTVEYWKEAVREYVNVISDYFFACSSTPRQELWRTLRKGKQRVAITNRQIERVEMMLLLYVHASFFGKRKILSKAGKELGSITKRSFRGADWETLRTIAARCWHELYH